MFTVLDKNLWVKSKSIEERRIFVKSCLIHRICSKHFRSEDFIRDLRNEMLGLPLRNLLKPGSYPILPQGNLLRGIVIWSGAARSVVQKT